jgi:hypothetical protein
MSCPCDTFVHPQPLAISAGLDWLPRQIAGFAEFRRAMLAAIRSSDPEIQAALQNWRARGEQDLGVMLLEMGAYVCDAIAFYDEVIANEEYLRTAQLRPSVRKLVELIGYRPRPAVAALAELAVLIEGGQPITIPSGTAFRSGAFGNEPPQVFETSADTVAYPAMGQISVTPTESTSAPVTVTSGTTGASSGSTGAVSYSLPASLNADDVVLVLQDGSDVLYPGPVAAAKFSFLPPPTGIAVLKATQRASLWSITDKLLGDPSAINGLVLTLDGLYRQIKTGDYVVLQYQPAGSADPAYGASGVTATSERLMHLTGRTRTTTKAGASKEIVTGPALRTPATQLTLEDKDLINKVAASTIDSVVVHWGLTNAGPLVATPATSVAPSSQLTLAHPVALPSGSTSSNGFLIEDGNGNGAAATISPDGTTLTVDQSDAPNQLTPPITAYGNVLDVSRGATVAGEVLGDGDASQTNQSFELKKSPLTYLSQPSGDNEYQVASTLQVFVNRILWSEVPSFFGVGPGDEVYIVRQDDDGDSFVIFGDGVNGALLPTGTGNVTANYRYGAGEASPPAGTITQLAKPVKGIQSVRNPKAAYGGTDAESAADIRACAPLSALILGRAVSIADLEAIAASTPGVRAVHAAWTWETTQQRQVALISYIGDSGTGANLLKTLQGLSDVTAPIVVREAFAKSASLTLLISCDPRYWGEDVSSNVLNALTAEKTGLLSPEQVGIGQPLFRSRIFEVVQSVPGVIAILSMTLRLRLTNLIDSVVSQPAVCPGVGYYFDFEGNVTVATTGGSNLGH